VKRPIDPRRIEVVDHDVAAILQTKTPHELLTMVSDAHRMARSLVEAGVRHSHPDWTPEQVWQEVVRRMTGGTD
jgi:hypothetical protein